MEKKIFLLLGYLLSFSVLHSMQPDNLILLTENTSFNEVSHLCQPIQNEVTMGAIAQGKKYNKTKYSLVSFIPNPKKKTLRTFKWRYTKRPAITIEDGNKKSSLELTWLQNEAAFNQIKNSKFLSTPLHPAMKILFAPNPHYAQNAQPKPYALMTQEEIHAEFINKVQTHQSDLIHYLDNKDFDLSPHIKTLEDHLTIIHQKTLTRYFQAILNNKPNIHYANLALIFTGYFEDVTEIFNFINAYLDSQEKIDLLNNALITMQDIAHSLDSSSLSPKVKIDLFYDILNEEAAEIKTLVDNLKATPITPDSFSKLFNKIIQHYIHDENFDLIATTNNIQEFHEYFSPLELDKNDYAKLLNSYLFNEKSFNVLHYLIANCNTEEEIIWKLLLKNNILRSSFLKSIFSKSKFEEYIITENNIIKECSKIYDFLDTLYNITQQYYDVIIDYLCAYPSLIIPFLQKEIVFDFQNYDSIFKIIHICFVLDKNGKPTINPMIAVAFQSNIETIINALQENDATILEWLTPDFYLKLLEIYFELSGLKTEDEKVNAKVKSMFNIMPLIQWLFQSKKDIEFRYSFLINLITNENINLTFFTEYAINHNKLLNLMMESSSDFIDNLIKIIQEYAKELMQKCISNLNLEKIIQEKNEDQIFSTPNDEILQLIINKVQNTLGETYDAWFNSFSQNNPNIDSQYKDIFHEIIKNEVIDTLTFNIIKNMHASIIVEEPNQEQNIIASDMIEDNPIQNIINQNTYNTLNVTIVNNMFSSIMPNAIASNIIEYNHIKEDKQLHDIVNKKPGLARRFLNFVCNHKKTILKGIAALGIIIEIFSLFNTPKKISVDLCTTDELIIPIQHKTDNA